MKSIICLKGSENIFEVGKDFLKHVDKEIDKNSKFIVSDNNEFDVFIQYYLESKKYKNVEVVFHRCFKNNLIEPKNNVGMWRVHKLPTLLKSDSPEAFKFINKYLSLICSQAMIYCHSFKEEDVIDITEKFACLEKPVRLFCNKMLSSTDGATNVYNRTDFQHLKKCHS